MKRSMLFSLFLLVVYTISGQASLSYNQVLFVKSADGTLTVPSGAVWKIQGVIYSSALPDPACTGSGSCSSITPHNDVITVNGSATNVRSVRSRGTASGGAGTTTYLWEQEFPIWLPEGSTLATGTGVSGISVIEFLE